MFSGKIYAGMLEEHWLGDWGLPWDLAGGTKDPPERDWIPLVPLKRLSRSQLQAVNLVSHIQICTQPPVLSVIVCASPVFVILLRLEHPEIIGLISSHPPTP